MASEGTSQGIGSLILQQEVEKFSKVQQILQRLYTIWNNVGVDEEQKINRTDQVWSYIFNLLQEIEDEETALYEDIKERIRNYEKKISDLIDELQLPKLDEIDGTLLVKEQTLRQQLDELSKMKHKRLKEFQELHAIELKYCKILGMPPLNPSSTTGVPTESDVYELQQHVNMLQEEKENRQQKFYRLKKELTTILEITELTPETPFEKEILTHKEDTLSLSTETFRLLEQIVTKTKSKRANLENEKAVLMDKLTVLWDMMKIEEKERKFFLSKHTDCRVSNLNAIKEEIARCEEIKKQNLSKYIDALREELLSLWNKCYLSQSLNMLPSIQEEEVSQTVLDTYDNEVAKWRKYYKDTEHIIQKIEKRQELWDQMILIENKAADPNRFKNRGGNLLQEEKQRKQLQKLLPELEEKIMIDIKNYEKENGKPFLYFGEKFEYFMEKQWEDRNNQKENEKMVRQKMRSKQIVNERTAGASAIKRPFCGMTPKSAPSKLLKSSAAVTIYRTPNFSVSKQIPSTIARLKNNKQSSNSSKKYIRNVLKEKNDNKPEVSGCLDSTTYTVFAEKLNRSSRIAHRSSVLSSRKVVGTRISTNKSKRKSNSQSLRKSLRKKTDTSKLTPARGKLGLPFLI